MGTAGDCRDYDTICGSARGCNNGLGWAKKRAFSGLMAAKKACSCGCWKLPMSRQPGSRSTTPRYVPIQLEGLEIEITPSSLQSFSPAGVSGQRLRRDGFRGSVSDIWAFVFFHPCGSMIRVLAEEGVGCLLGPLEFPGIFLAFAQKKLTRDPVCRYIASVD